MMNRTMGIRAAFSAALIFGVSGAARAQNAPVIRLQPAEKKLEHEFSAITGVRELADARVLVSDLTEGKVVVADFATGAVTQIGRTGKGPGEYENPGPLLRLGGDSTLLIERRTSRWHLFHGAALVRTLPPDDPAVSAVQRLATGADGRGHVVRTITFANENAPPPPTGPESSAVIRVHRGTARRDTLAMVKNGKTVISTTTNGRGEITSVSLYAAPYTVSEETALFEDGWLAVARLAPYRVDWIAADGKVAKGRPISWPAAKVTERDLDVFFTASTGKRTETLTPREREARQVQIDRALQNAPDAIPPFLRGGLLAMEDGQVLIRHPQTAASPSVRYQVVDRSGRARATIGMGKGETIAAVSRKWVYVVTTDDDGLQFLSRHAWQSSAIKAP
jgi:hypothetical protein